MIGEGRSRRRDENLIVGINFHETNERTAPGNYNLVCIFRICSSFYRDFCALSRGTRSCVFIQKQRHSYIPAHCIHAWIDLVSKCTDHVYFVDADRKFFNSRRRDALLNNNSVTCFLVFFLLKLF